MVGFPMQRLTKASSFSCLLGVGSGILLKLTSQKTMNTESEANPSKWPDVTKPPKQMVVTLDGVTTFISGENLECFSGYTEDMNLDRLKGKRGWFVLAFKPTSVLDAKAVTGQGEGQAESVARTGVANAPTLANEVL